MCAHEVATPGVFHPSVRPSIQPRNAMQSLTHHLGEKHKRTSTASGSYRVLSSRLTVDSKPRAMLVLALTGHKRKLVIIMMQQKVIQAMF